jgi:CBS domain-containing protein
MDVRALYVRPKMKILDAIDFILRNHVTGAPVVDETGHLVGMLSEKDCLKLVSAGANAEAPTGTVADYMTTKVTTISPEVDIYYVAGLFLNYGFRRLPVVENEKLVGAITRFDILRIMRATSVLNPVRPVSERRPFKTA